MYKRQDENDCRRLLQTAFEYPGPALVRYPRGSGPGVRIEPGLEPLPIGKGEVRRTGRDIAILAFGSRLAPALAAGEALDASVANMRFVKPLDEELILDLAAHHRLLVTVEENAVAGGAGSAIAEFLAERGLTNARLHLGLPDRYLPHDNHELQLAACGLDAGGIQRSIRAALDRLDPADSASA